MIDIVPYVRAGLPRVWPSSSNGLGEPVLSLQLELRRQLNGRATRATQPFGL